MGLKILGTIFILVGCGGFGLKLVSNHLYEERSLRELIRVLDFMECELQYHLTPLPDLCRQAAAESTGIIQKTFYLLSSQLEDQLSPDVGQCVQRTLAQIKTIPHLSYSAMELLGRSLGRFDIEGQLKGLEAVRQECRTKLNTLMENRDIRLRNYQTLGLCAGAALAILLI